MSSDRVRITIYECVSTIYHRVVKEKELTKSKSKLIETCSKVLELVSVKKLDHCIKIVFMHSFIL
jgi:hypothetical protein